VRISVSGESPCDLAPVRAAMRRAARPYRLPAGTTVHLAFVADPEMRSLNRRFRGIDRTTDVLSFGERIPPGLKGAAAVGFLRAALDGKAAAKRFDLGEIAISPGQAARQARRGRRLLAREVAFLAAHGVLHLLGFEDETPAGYREMVRLGHDAARQKTVKR
jgi:probable rRNA maturation factor